MPELNSTRPLLSRDQSLVPLSDAATLTGLSASWLRKLGRKGVISLKRPGGPTGNLYVSARDIARMIDTDAYQQSR